MKRLGIDIGGTVTDFVLYDVGNGALVVDTAPSTPAGPAFRPRAARHRPRGRRAGLALRAWAAIDPVVARGTVPLDRAGPQHHRRNVRQQAAPAPIASRRGELKRACEHRPPLFKPCTAA